jgi:flagellar L-ring protein precursor FlgH
VRKATLLALFLVSVSLSGCSSMMGSLRRDLDDSVAQEGPTVGGRFSEFGQLNGSDDLARNNPYGSLGHSERGPASERSSRRNGGWVTDAAEERNSRDRQRGENYQDEQEELTYSQNPNHFSDGMRRQYRAPGTRATRRDFQDDGVNEGSLWASDGQTNYYFTKNKIRGVGDLVTVKVEDNLLKDVHREVRRTLSQREKEREILAAQERINAGGGAVADGPSTAKASGPAGAPDAAKKPEAGATSQAAPVRADSASPREATAADIDVGRSVDLANGDVVMAEILERFPNGNYKIRGTKRVQYRNSARMMNFVGIVRGSDIGEDDVVTSGKLYEYQLEVIR